MRRRYHAPKNGWHRAVSAPGVECYVLRVGGHTRGYVERRSQREPWSADAMSMVDRQRVRAEIWRRCDAKRWVEARRAR